MVKAGESVTSNPTGKALDIEKASVTDDRYSYYHGKVPKAGCKAGYVNPCRVDCEISVV